MQAKTQRDFQLQLFQFGKTVKEIAMSQDIQSDTVKKHLQSIFKKTQTHRQSELIQLLMQFL